MIFRLDYFLFCFSIFGGLFLPFIQVDGCLGAACFVWIESPIRNTPRSSPLMLHLLLLCVRSAGKWSYVTKKEKEKYVVYSDTMPPILYNTHNKKKKKKKKNQKSGWLGHSFRHTTSRLSITTLYMRWKRVMCVSHRADAWLGSSGSDRFACAKEFREFIFILFLNTFHSGIRIHAKNSVIYMN